MGCMIGKRIALLERDVFEHEQHLRNIQNFKKDTVVVAEALLSRVRALEKSHGYADAAILITINEQRELTKRVNKIENRRRSLTF